MASNQFWSPFSRPPSEQSSKDLKRSADDISEQRELKKPKPPQKMCGITDLPSRRGPEKYVYTARIIPYTIDANNNIFVLLAKTHRYRDWTAFGGNCGDPPSRISLYKCGYRELNEETHCCYDDIEFNREYRRAVILNDQFLGLDFSYYHVFLKRPEIVRFLFFRKEIFSQIIDCYKKNLPELQRQYPDKNGKHSFLYETIEISMFNYTEFWKKLIFGLFFEDPNVITGDNREIVKSKLEKEYKDYCFDASIGYGLMDALVNPLNQSKDEPCSIQIKQSDVTGDLIPGIREFLKLNNNQLVDSFTTASDVLYELMIRGKEYVNDNKLPIGWETTLHKPHCNLKVPEDDRQKERTKQHHHPDNTLINKVLALNN